ncbi:hypothetical protein, partial [uncultured Desulfovibrio sp.]|uniref:hypothetical protein n=1 Tax=uncultured Desulfovibrio sp. TaxID=167968 RepID=UPI002620EC5A
YQSEAQCLLAKADTTTRKGFAAAWPGSFAKSQAFSRTILQKFFAEFCAEFLQSDTSASFANWHQARCGGQHPAGAG